MTTYKEAGVDIDAADEAVERIKGVVKATRNKGVLADVGSFGGLFDINKYGLKEPVLVSSTDGVGTKIKLAFLTGIYDTVGQDLANHCTNDILVQGAIPLYFMDYIATAKLKPEVMQKIIEGFCTACRQNEMALLGGEMAEMPGIYQEGHFDLAGFIVGVVEKSKIIDGSKIKPGDVVIGLKSTGLQTNGFSLAIKVFKEAGLLEKKAKELMAVHSSFLPIIKPHLESGIIHGMAHITGSGLEGNIPRVLPENCKVIIDKSKWQIPQIFKDIQKTGNVPEDDMFRTFNMGIGYIVIVDKKDALKFKEGTIIGKVVPGENKVEFEKI
jgi:phosphoribosylformylglycinamidine cyclo-ligase